MRLVSVITPFYNTPVQFLQEAVESVFTQTYDNWELLLVDDGSTSECSSVARQCAHDRPGKVRYLEHSGHKNLGLSASRNLGATNAMGVYIAFLDSDDVWLPRKLEQQVALMHAHSEAAMIYGNTQYWYSWRGNPKDHTRDFMPRLGVRAGTLMPPPTLLPLYLRGQAAVPCPCSVMVRRDVFERIGGFETAFRNMYEDQVFYSKVCLAAPVFVADTCWDRYRQHPDQMCSVVKKRGQVGTTRLFFLRWLEHYLADQRISDPEVWKTLREELRLCDRPLSRYLRRRARKLLARLRRY
jgi:glycosyltransferase involved in cell wall biosynthesis